MLAAGPRASGWRRAACRALSGASPIGGHYRLAFVGHDDQQPAPPAEPRRGPVPLAVFGAIALDAVALGAAVTLVFAAATGMLDQGLAVGVVVAAATAALIGSIDVTPLARPGVTGRLLGRELVVVTLALASLPLAFGLSVPDGLDPSLVALASVVVAALGLRMALLTRRADVLGRAQAGRVALLSQLATQDPLTGLPNRTQFEDRLAMALASQRRS